MQVGSSRSRRVRTTRSCSGAASAGCVTRYRVVSSAKRCLLVLLWATQATSRLPPSFTSLSARSLARSLALCPLHRFAAAQICAWREGHCPLAFAAASASACMASCATASARSSEGSSMDRSGQVLCAHLVVHRHLLHLLQLLERRRLDGHHLGLAQDLAQVALLAVHQSRLGQDLLQQRRPRLRARAPQYHGAGRVGE